VKFAHLINLSPLGKSTIYRGHTRLLCSLACALGLYVHLAPFAHAQDFHQRPDVRSFLAEVAARQQFEEQDLLDLFAKVQNKEDVLRYIAPAPAGMKKNWAVYRSRFLDQLRIQEGVKFWRRHESDIARASQVYGVPAEIIVGIIGVETIYGRNTGNFRVLDALTTIAFNHPRRAEFFRKEVESFLVFARANKLEPLSVLGSYAGAIGLPQFMPSSILRYAVDFDGSGQIDLRNSPVDAVGSVAKFLADHGWVEGRAATFAMRMDSDARLEEPLRADILPQFSATQLKEFGIHASSDTPPEEVLALIELPNGDAPSTYTLGTKNFYVITRYNRSSFYAMAVLDLANAVKNQMNAPKPVARGKKKP
jgi:membrane-bound lytic murein transglycosylase B